MASDPQTSTAADQARLAAAIGRYLADRHGWRADQYRLEFEPAGPGMVTVRAIFLEDERRPAPGGGRSLELQVEVAGGAVLRELSFQ